MNKLFAQALFARGGMAADFRALEFVDKIFPSVPKGTVFSTPVEQGMVFGTALTAGAFNIFIFIVCTKNAVHEKEIVVNTENKAVDIDRLVINDWYDLIGGLLKLNAFRDRNSSAFHYDGIREAIKNFIDFTKANPDEFLSRVKCLDRNSNSTRATVSGGLPTLGKKR